MKKNIQESTRKEEIKLCMINLMMKTRLFKKEDNKRKKEKCENLNNDEKKNSQKNTRKKERKLCMITLRLGKKSKLEKMIKKKYG